MYNYAIRLERDDTPGLAVFCRDLPRFNSYGDNLEHALAMALDGIETTLSMYVDDRQPIPAATPPETGEHVVYLPAVAVAKIVLWNAMMEQGMRKADLCRLLGVSQTQGDRLVDFLHISKMEQVESALEKLGFVKPFPYKIARFYYAPFKHPDHFMVQRLWINQRGITTAQYDEITLETLSDPDASEDLKAALSEVAHNQFRTHLYQACPIPAKTTDRSKQDFGGILFNFTSMPAGMKPGKDWVPISPVELRSVDDFAYRHLIGMA